MKKGFSILNILIVLSLLIFVFLFYDKYINEEVGILEKESISEDTFSDNRGIELEKEDRSSIVGERNKVSPLPDPSTLPIKGQKIEEIIPIESGLIGYSTVNGYYENITYNYSITVPPDWPLKVREDNDVSLGTVPPKNGQGAIIIEVGENIRQEVDKVKKEVKKYAGMVNLSEEAVNIGGVTGTKLILNNLVINTKNYYIVLSKSGLDYIIKYSDESSLFIAEVEEALNTFKFIK